MKEKKSRAKKQKGTILDCWNIEINLEWKAELNMLIQKYKDSMQIQETILGMKDEVESPVDFVNNKWIWREVYQPLNVWKEAQRIKHWYENKI